MIYQNIRLFLWLLKGQLFFFLVGCHTMILPKGSCVFCEFLEISKLARTVKSEEYHKFWVLGWIFTSPFRHKLYAIYSWHMLRTWAFDLKASFPKFIFTLSSAPSGGPAIALKYILLTQNYACVCLWGLTYSTAQTVINPAKSPSLIRLWYVFFYEKLKAAPKNKTV